MITRLFAGVLTLSLLAGCGGGAKTPSTDTPKAPETSTPAAPKEVTITFARGKDSTPATEKALEAFRAKHPNIKVNFQEMPNDSSVQRDQYATKFSAGDDSIDVIGLDIVWPPEFGAAGWVLPLDEYFTKAEQDKFLQGPLNANKYEGKLYSVPLFTAGGAFYYRKDILDKYGKQPPKNWDEIVALSKELVGKDGIEVGMVFQGAQYEGLTCNILEYMRGNGGDVFDKNGKVVVDSPNNVEAIKFMRKLIDDKVVPAGVTTYKEPDALRMFIEGKALFMRHWAPAYATIQNSPESKVKDKVGVTAVPVGPNGTAPSSTLGGWNVGINANVPKERKDAAVTFVKWMTSEEASKIFALEGAYIPIYPTLFDDKEILAKYPHWADFKNIFLNSHPRPISPLYPQVSDVIQVNMHKALSGSISAEEAAKNMQQGIQKIVDKK
ncbi:MAG: ABC transporter substrate-binding protein [Bacillota bacterium]